MKKKFYNFKPNKYNCKNFKPNNFQVIKTVLNGSIIPTEQYLLNLDLIQKSEEIIYESRKNYQ
jgi:hypothetical protein